MSLTFDLDTSDYDGKMPIFQRVLANLPLTLLETATDMTEQEMKIEIPKGNTGKLEGSVSSQIYGYNATVQTNTGYGKAVDEGRRGFDVYAKNVRFLRFFYLGKIVYTKHSHPGPAAANNFTARTLQNVGGRMLSELPQKMQMEFKQI